MQRRRFLTTASLLTLGSPIARLLAYPRARASGRVELIRNNVGYYTDRGGTIGFYLPTTGKGGVVVDTQYPGPAREFLHTALQGSERVELLINTHHHGDHTGGNGVVAPLAKQYVIHARAKENLAFNEAQRTEGEALPLPTTTFTDEWTMGLADGEERVTARHFGPAHTGGDAIIHFENANVAHLGDLLFNRRFPYIDVRAGGNLTNWAHVMRKVRKAYDKDTRYVFGHAAESYPVTGTHEDLKSFENYLSALRDYVRKECKQGTSLEDLKAKTVTIPKAPEWRYGVRLRDINLEVMWAEAQD